MYHKWQSYNVWFLRHGAWQAKFFVILDHFLPFYPPNNLKNQNFEKRGKNARGHYHFTQVYHKWHSYDVWLHVLVMSHRHFRVNPLYICLNVKELLARNRCNIWSLSDCNRTRTHNHLVRKQIFCHFEPFFRLLLPPPTHPLTT